ncbi:MAG: hypothetical protein ACKVU1_11300 [bacterium]
MRVAALALSLAFLAAHGCTERPAEPARTNPLDPGGGGSGADLLSLRATLGTSAVNLFWQAIPVDGRAGYRVYRRAASDAEFALIAEPTPAALGYRDAEPIPDALNIYAVTVLNARGEESSLDAFAHDSVDTPPRLLIGEVDAPIDTTATRAVHVVFFSARAETVFLADSTRNDPETGTQLADAVAFAPNATGYDYTLAAGHGSDNTKLLYGRIRRNDGTLSPIASASVRVRALDLGLAVDGRTVGPVVTGRRSIAIALASATAESVEFTFADSFLGLWSPFAESFEESLLAPGVSTLRVRVVDDFGVIAAESIAVIGDDLANVRLSIDGDAAQTRLCSATVAARDGAVYRICLSPGPIASPGDAPCETLAAYSAPIEDWALPSCTATARVYAVVANDWVPEGVIARSDEIFAVNAVPSAEFTTPDSAGGDTLVIGETAELAGFALGASCSGTIDSVSLFVRWIALDDTSGALPDTLVLGRAALLLSEDDPPIADWFLDWTPAAELPPGRVEIIARVTSGKCEGSRAVAAVLAAAPARARARGSLAR